MFTPIPLQRIFFSKLKEVTLRGAIIISIWMRARQKKIRGGNHDEGRRLSGSASLQVLLLAVTLGCGAPPALAEEPQTVVLPEVTVHGVCPSDELIGPYNQPRWAARGRFSSSTDVYVLPPYEFNIDLDYTGTIPKHGQTQNLFTQEFELGLPHRFQIAYENNFVLEKDHSQITTQTIEGRYALADWGKLPLNPTLFAEYHFGVGKDYGGADDDSDATERIPDSIELRLLLGGQFGRNYQWALNIFHEFEMGGELERETGFNQALVYSIRDEYLKVGLETQFIFRTDAEPQSKPEYEFDIGPSFTWKPSALTRLDVAALFGTTSDSPVLSIYAVFSIAFGDDGNKGESVAPVSTQHR
jgi:hypothetical protein